MSMNDLPTFGGAFLEHHSPLGDIVVRFAFVSENRVLSEGDDSGMAFGEDPARIDGDNIHRFANNITTGDHVNHCTWAGGVARRTDKEGVVIHPEFFAEVTPLCLGLILWGDGDVEPVLCVK
jgi:hypothetical protein